mgnify:CR=1 FL=1
MCGIVGYFGGAGNNLTRILTAMSAIIYRAPDSTGVGLFGDDLEPMRARKSVGSVARLASALLTAAAYPDQPGKLAAIWEPAADDLESHQALQRRVLAFEGFPVEEGSAAPDAPPVFDALTGANGVAEVRIGPGVAGRPGPMETFPIRSRKDLRRAIDDLTARFDLSAVVIRALIRDALSRTLADARTDGGLEVSPDDVLAAFDALFDSVFVGERGPKPLRLDYGWSQRNPYAQRYLWRFLGRTPIQVPQDYDRDGVRCLFRLLDSALLCRLALDPRRHEALQRTLESLWPEAKRIPNTDWRTLYWAEKGANVYGWAAAAVLTYLRRTELPDGAAPAVLSPAEAGRTDPAHLRFFAQPILAHGRWALQSPVTLENAHPHLDRAGHRAVVINGQFNGEVEARTRELLEGVGLGPFRSENSTEYFALLWGYYYECLEGERKRFSEIRSQLDAGLTGFHIGSQAIDYYVYEKVRGKTPVEIDEMAFLETVRKMYRGGGQIAVAGLSLHSPRRFYVACHNRPAFVVYRPDGDDYMVVSDINAALGLFPQSLVHSRMVDIHRRERDKDAAVAALRDKGAAVEEVDACKASHEAEIDALLAPFKVRVLPLDGAEIFCRIETVLEAGVPERRVAITDFAGDPFPDIADFETTLNPAQVRKGVYGSFFETHLAEIPDRLRDQLRFYLPGPDPLPRLDLRERAFRRRFGPGLASLKRVIFAGMGSAHHVGRMIRGALLGLLPELEILAVQPVAIGVLRREVVPERDLVVLTSWSATTADMVQFAADLKARGVMMVGITEKVFADMALIADAGGGVIPAMSGEEVTISGVKSIACMAFAGLLLGTWLAGRLGREAAAEALLEEMRDLPDVLSGMLEDDTLKAFSENLAIRSSRSHACVFIGSLHLTGTCREAALKLEENACTAVARPMDYRDFAYYILAPDPDRRLVVVGATDEERLPEAMSVMKRLFIAGVPFAALTYEHEHVSEIRFYSQDQCFLLPKVSDALQPLADLIFYYDFAFRYARAHGRGPGDVPRNRAKSVTAGRSRPHERRSPRRWLLDLDRELSAWPAPSAAPDPDAETAWERAAKADWERVYHRQIRTLGELLREPDPLSRLIPESFRDPGRIKEMLFGTGAGETEVVFVPFDRPAASAARHLAARWGRFLESSVRVAPPGEPLPQADEEDTLLVFLAAREVDSGTLLQRIRESAGACLWFGPEIPEKAVRIFRRSMGCHVFDPQIAAFIEPELLYAAVSLIFIEAFHEADPVRAKVLKTAFGRTADVVRAILEDADFRTAIESAMADDRRYGTAFVLTPPDGAGEALMERFDAGGILALQAHLYGESAHGPLATVDDRVEEKYIRLRRRDRMAGRYGEELVAGWEAVHLAGESVDAFLARSPTDLPPRPGNPFFAENAWYLPVLEPDYDTDADNLILMDATARGHLADVLDELATFGCRFARMTVLTQAAFRNGPEVRAMAKFPVSHFLFLPTPGGGDQPIPDLLLPFALGPTGMVLAAAAADVRGIGLTPATPEAAMERAFGTLGRTMMRHRIDIQYLDHRLIESLRNLAPLISEIEGVARYAVRVIDSEADLKRMIDDGRLYSPDETIQRFRMQAPAGAFYLLHPEREGFEGRARFLADETFQDGEWDLWGEPYGNAWKVLTHRIPGIQEGADNVPILMIPLVDAEQKTGWLFYLHVHYREWDHDAPVGPQIETTVRALGQGMRFHNFISPRYLKIASRFNEEMVPQGHTWDDRFLVMVRRRMLFQKGSSFLAGLLARRISALLGLKRRDGLPVTLDAVTDAIDHVWPSLDRIEAEPDARRWGILFDALTKILILEPNPSNHTGEGTEM